jgi:hypothetical protein
MATLTTLRTAIRDYTLFPSSIFTDPICDELVNGVLESMEHLHNFQETLSRAALTYLTTSDGIALPDGFLGEEALYEVDPALTADPSARLSEIPKITRAQWVQRVNASSGHPAFPRPSLRGFYYYLSGMALFVVPQPTTTVSLIFDHFLKSPPLTTGSPTNYATTQYYDCLKWGAIRDAFLFLHEEERAQAFAQRFQIAFTAATKRDFAQTAGGAPPKSRGA